MSSETKLERTARESERARLEARCEEHGAFLEDFLGRVTEWTGTNEDELAEAIDALGAIQTALSEPVEDPNHVR